MGNWALKTTWVPVVASLLVGCTNKEAPPKAAQPSLTWVRSVPAGIEFTKSEVTVDQYRMCVQAGECTVPNSNPLIKQCNWEYHDRGNHPMNCMDWNQATTFCKWVGGKLPTEEEWYAEASNKGMLQYPWGDQHVACDYAVAWLLDDKGREGNRGCGRGSTWPVCSKERGNSVSGLCDMIGNVWEWTSTSAGPNRVLRGGAWSVGFWAYLLATARIDYPPAAWGEGNGFRCGRAFR